MYARKQCFHCQEKQMKTLFAVMEQGVPHHHSQHKTIYSYRVFGRCQACGRLQLERYSHDCWGYHGDEDWDMYWWFLFDEASAEQLLEQFDNCTTPLNPNCSCSIHQSLRTASEHLYTGRSSVEYAQDKAEYQQAQVVISEEGLRLQKADRSAGS